MAKTIKINKKKSHKITTVMTASHKRTVVSERKKNIRKKTESLRRRFHLYIASVHCEDTKCFRRNVLC